MVLLQYLISNKLDFIVSKFVGCDGSHSMSDVFFTNMLVSIKVYACNKNKAQN